MTENDNVRIDKWLWAARFFKTRSLAADAVDRGRVRIGGEPVKPARSVKIDDKIFIDNGSNRWEVVVLGLSDKRGPAPMAQALYHETEESIERRENDQEARRLFPEPGSTIKGRPTKRDRRAITRAGGARAVPRDRGEPGAPRERFRGAKVVPRAGQHDQGAADQARPARYRQTFRWGLKSFSIV